jgi:hypothetical protein
MEMDIAPYLASSLNAHPLKAGMLLLRKGLFGMDIDLEGGAISLQHGD